MFPCSVLISRALICTFLRGRGHSTCVAPIPNSYIHFCRGAVWKLPGLALPDLQSRW
jgi:hypothetical protein